MREYEILYCLHVNPLFFLITSIRFFVFLFYTSIFCPLLTFSSLSHSFEFWSSFFPPVNHRALPRWWYAIVQEGWGWWGAKVKPKRWGGAKSEEEGPRASANRQLSPLLNKWKINFWRTWENGFRCETIDLKRLGPPVNGSGRRRTGSSRRRR